jgi:transcriptional regulator with XRE-family HTH domain
MNSAQAFGKVLKKLRVERGMSQEQLGFRGDLDRTYISLLELGKRQPSLPTMIALARALSVGLPELTGLFEDELGSEDVRRVG